MTRDGAKTPAVSLEPARAAAGFADAHEPSRAPLGNRGHLGGGIPIPRGSEPPETASNVAPALPPPWFNQNRSEDV